MKKSEMKKPAQKDMMHKMPSGMMMKDSEMASMMGAPAKAKPASKPASKKSSKKK